MFFEVDSGPVNDFHYRTCFVLYYTTHTMQQAPGISSSLPTIAKHVNFSSLLLRIERSLKVPSFRSFALVLEYLRFLHIKISMSDWEVNMLSPSPQVDEVWHLHVLDTIRYGAECQAACGHLIQHNPDNMFLPERQLNERRAGKNIRFTCFLLSCMSYIYA